MIARQSQLHVALAVAAVFLHLPQANAQTPAGKALPTPVQPVTAPSKPLVAATRIAWCSALSPDEELLVTGYGQYIGDLGLIRAWNLKTGKIAWEVAEPRGVRAVAFSPDGMFIASGNYLGEIQVRDARSGKLERQFGDSGVNIVSLAFSADGNFVAASGYRGGRIVRLWNVATGQPAKTFDGHTAAVYTIAFSPDNKQLVTASRDSTVRLWSIDDGGALQILQHPAGVSAAVYVAGGQQVVTLCGDGQLRVFNAADGKLLQTLGGPSRVTDASALTASPDGKLLAISDDANVQLWDAASWQQREAIALPQSLALGLLFNRDGTRLITSGSDSAVRIWDVAQRRQTDEVSLPAEVQEGAGPVAGLALSPDGTCMAVATGGMKLDLRDTATGKLAKTFTAPAGVTAVAFAPDGNSLAAASGTSAIIWDVASGAERSKLAGHRSLVRAVAWSPDGKLLATAGEDTTIRLWETNNWKSISVLEGHTAPAVALTFFQGGARLLSGSADAAAQVWDVAKRQSISVLRGHGASVGAIAISPDGKVIATGSDDGTARLWDAATFRPRTVITNQEPVKRLAFSPDGALLATGGEQGSIRLWDASRGSQRSRFTEHASAVTGLVFLPDASGLLSGSLDASIRLWKAADAAPPPLVHLSANRPETLGASFSSDGKWLATTGADRMVTLRDPKTGSIRRVFRGHTNRVYRAVFSPDSSLLASASSDGTVRMWSLATGESLAAFKAWRQTLAAARAVAISPDGKLVASGADDGTIKLWDVAQRQELREFAVQELPVTALVFTPDGKQLISSTGDWRNFTTPGTLRCWEVATGKKLADLEGHTSEIKSLAIDASGQWLASGGSNRTVLLWKLSERAPVGTIRIDSAAASVAFSPDGGRLAVGGNLGDVTEWNVQSAKQIRRLAGHAKAASGISYHPNGDLLATAGHDGYLSLWKLGDDGSEAIPAGREDSDDRAKR